MSPNAQKTREFFPNVLRRIKLRTRLFVTFLIISLVPVITIGIFSYHAYTQSMNERSNRLPYNLSNYSIIICLPSLAFIATT